MARTAFLVHGNPDTHRMWEPLRAHLSREAIVAPDLPGFGCPVPAGFDATKEAYVDWLIPEIEKVGEPVDLVGHDWGALLVQRIVSLRPDLIRTWACGDGPADTEYVWHDAAQVWQTPGAGEQMMAAFSVEQWLPVFVAEGIPDEMARDTLGRVDDVMKDCILKLYRSAVNVGEEWQPGVEKVERPALIIWGKNDVYVPLRFGERLAERVKGEFLALDCGHWWPIVKAKEAAEALEAFWARH